MADYLRIVLQKFTELDNVTNFERRKADEYKEEAVLLNQQLDEYKKQYLDLQSALKSMRKEFSKHVEMLQKMELC